MRDLPAGVGGSRLRKGHIVTLQTVIPAHLQNLGSTERIHRYLRKPYNKLRIIEGIKKYPHMGGRGDAEGKLVAP